MGAVDLVIQVESPKSVAARAAADRPRRPLGRRRQPRAASSPSSAPTCSSARWSPSGCATGEIETTVVPRNALDVLAQQIVAIAAAAPDDEPVARRRPARARHAHALLRRAQPHASSRTCSTCSTAATRRRSSPSCARGSSGTGWRARSARARARASWPSPTPARSPTAACSRSPCPTAAASASSTRRWSTRRARARRSCSARRTWRIEEITRDRVIVTPAPGRARRGPVLEGRRHRAARASSARRSARSRAGRSSSEPEALDARLRPRPRARPTTSSSSCASSRRPRASCRRDRTIVVERFRDEIGDWRLCVLSPVRRPRPRRLGAGADARGSATSSASSPTRSGPTTGSSSTSPTPTSRRAPTWCCSSPTRSRTWSSPSCRLSALFGARFRENAGRALLIPRARPGKRTPLWQQRLKAQSLLEVAKRYGEFPIVLETYRECLRDVLDVPGLVELLRALHRARVCAGRGRDADGVAVRLLAAVRLRRHLHVRGRHAERRAPRGGAVARPRPAARAARPGGAARADRPGRAGRRSRPTSSACRERTRAADARRAARRAARARRPDARPRPRRGCSTASTREAMLDASCARERRARCAMRIGGEQRWIDAAEDAGLYRDALGAVAARRPARGVPRGRARRAGAARAPLRAHARAVHDRASCAARYGVDPPPVLRELERVGRAGPRRAAARRDASASGATPRCCGGCAARRWRCCARRSSPPTSARWRASCPAGRASTATRRRAPGSTGCARRSCRCRGWRCPPRSGSATCCRAASAPTRRRGWTSSAPAGELVWIGAGALGRSSGRVALYFREDLALLGPPPLRGRDRRSRASAHEAIRERLAAGACFFTDLLADVGARARGAPGGAVGPRLGGRGDQRRVRAAAGAAADAAPALSASARGRAARAAAVRARRRARGRAAGPGPLVADRAAVRGAGRSGRAPPALGRAAARALRHRHARAGAGRGHPRRLLGALRRARRSSRRSAIARRGYFVEGLGGAQFALPGAVERLRAQRADDTSAAGRAGRDRPGAALRRRAAVARARRRRGVAAPRAGGRAPTWCSSAASRCCTSSAAARALQTLVRAGRRAAGAGARGARGPRPRAARSSAWRSSASTASRRWRRRWGRRCVALGFREGPRRLTLSA